MVDAPGALRNAPWSAHMWAPTSRQDPKRPESMPLHARRHRRFTVPLLVLALNAFPPSSASGQEAEEERDPFTGDASFGLTVTEGNTETLSLSFTGRLGYNVDRHTWSFASELIRTRTDGEVEANRGNVELGYDFEPSERLFLSSQFRASYNRPAGIDRRLAPGVGVGYDVLRDEFSRLSLNAGANWVAETFTDDSRQSSIYFNIEQEFKLRVNSTTDLEQRLAYSPRPSDLGDYLVQASLALTTKVWKLLGIKTQITDEYDSTPFVDPETGEPRSRNDLTFITGLNVSF